jgi:hypothetical protein
LLEISFRVLSTERLFAEMARVEAVAEEEAAASGCRRAEAGFAVED